MIESLLRLGSDPAFRRFQNKIAGILYDQLDRGYKEAEGEVALLTRMATAANGQSDGPVSVYADKIHGRQSFVNFKHRADPDTKELGDLALIAIVTNGRERIFSRMTIVQNKKAKKGVWSIDQGQLFLLKNFPTLSGPNALFSDNQTIHFLNRSACLGSYGLLHEPGEMIFLAASHVAELQRGKKSVSIKDICLVPDPGLGPASAVPFGLPYWALGDPIIFHETIHLYERLLRRSPSASLWCLGGSLGFFGNTKFARDLSDLVREWTQICIGEPTFAFGQVLDARADAVLNALLRRVNADIFDPTDTPREVFGESDSDFTVMAFHIDIEGLQG